jgi:hypothetical protein
MTSISEFQNAACQKVEKELIIYSAGEVTKASGSTVFHGMGGFIIATCWTLSEGEEEEETIVGR